MEMYSAHHHSSMLLSIMVGTGHQMLTIAMAIVAFASFGFLSPANRGGLMTAAVLLFIFAGVIWIPFIPNV